MLLDVSSRKEEERWVSSLVKCLVQFEKMLGTGSYYENPNWKRTRHHLAHTRVAVPRGRPDARVDKATETPGPSYVTGGSVKRAANFFQSEHKFTTRPRIPLPGVYPRETTTYVHTRARTGRFVAATFAIVKLWKRPEYPPTGEQTTCGVSTPWSTVTGTNTGELGDDRARWEQPDGTYTPRGAIPCAWNVRKRQVCEDREGVAADGPGDLGGEGSVLKLDCGGGCTTG